MSRERESARNVQRFQGVLVFKAHRLLYHSTLGLTVIKKKKKDKAPVVADNPERGSVCDSMD